MEQNNSNLNPRVIISGGGTGGHIFPAVAIANEIKRCFPQSQILFVGAEGRMEMEKVPKAGYEIKGLPIAGLQRRLTTKNLLVPFKVIASSLRARKILKDFKPDIAIGVGGYASFPTLQQAQKLNIPTLIQEQNSYPGITNRQLAKQVQKICVAYEGMEKWFPKDKIVFTGNPIRQNVINIEGKRAEAIARFGLKADKPIVLSIGGSLGARTINDSLSNNLQFFADNDVQLLWQSGKFYYNEEKANLAKVNTDNVKLMEFIYEMDLAYACADVIISRAGAISISELCCVGKPAILVPSPNVAEDHQTKNAMALVNRNAALIIKDSDSKEQLVGLVEDLLKNENKRQQLSQNIKQLGVSNADIKIVQQVIALLENKTKKQ
jgi:undecaprenyldiphospho-muramoylpentapeptide beta-N-acetylglucosaminyltransferase